MRPCNGDKKMMQQKIPMIPDRPAFCGTMVVGGGRADCRVHGDSFRVRAPGKLLARMAALCDGERNREDVIRGLSSEWREDNVRDLMQRLAETGLLQEANDQTSSLWRVVSNPRQYGDSPGGDNVAALVHAARERLNETCGFDYRPITDFPLRRTLQKRKSTRTFADSLVSEEEILALLWAAYGVVAVEPDGSSRRTVSSGGALYPLNLYFCNLRQASGLEPGLYAVEYRHDGQVGLKPCSGGDVAALGAALNEPDLLSHAQGVFVIGGRFSWSAEKYGNRALLLVTLEAGHAAQNILLAAAELELAAVEVAGFAETALGRAFDLPPGVTPLAAMFFGAMPSSPELDAARQAWSSGVAFSWVDTKDASFQPPFHLGMARVGDDEWSWGRDADSGVAHDKAVAEAWERRAWREPQGIVTARYADLPRAIDPKELVQYNDWQYEASCFPFRPFDRREIRHWVELERFDRTDETVPRAWVPAEFVYSSKSLPCLHGATPAPLAGACTSSGMAAFPTRAGAMERGLLEVIERDAFMVLWLTHRVTREIDRALLPDALKARVDALKEAGVRVVFRDISLDSVPVILAFGQCVCRHFTVVTTAAAFSAERAADHALTELEASVSAALLQDDRLPTPAPESVRSPEDHCHLYAQRRYFRRADWLAAPGETSSLTEVERDRPRSIDRLLAALNERGYRIYRRNFVNDKASLHQGRTPLHIVRALVPGMIPITFGYGTEPVAMPRLDRFGGMWRPNRRQAFFPHPFQ
jgi:ribosomal protein S12 methylthiotransferase accessory factor